MVFCFNGAMTTHRKQRKLNDDDRVAVPSGDARRIDHAGVVSQTKTGYSLIERIERALVLLAYFIELDGDVHVPMYEKFESELQELKKTEDARSRARRRLMEYSAGNLKAASLPDLIFNLDKPTSPSAT